MVILASILGSVNALMVVDIKLIARAIADAKFWPITHLRNHVARFDATRPPSMPAWKLELYSGGGG